MGDFKMNNLLNNSLLGSHAVRDRDTGTNSEKPKSSWTIYCDISYIEGVIEEYSACRDMNISYQRQNSILDRMDFNLTIICDLK